MVVLTRMAVLTQMAVLNCFNLDVRFSPHNVLKPDGRFTLAGAKRRDSVTLERQNRRNSLLSRFGQARRQLDRNAESLSFDRYQQLALSLLSTTHVHQALDIHQESDAMRTGYGMKLFGQSCLAARRVVERAEQRQPAPCCPPPGTRCGRWPDQGY